MDPYRTGIIPPAKQPKALENNESSNKSSTMQHSKLRHDTIMPNARRRQQGGAAGAVWQTGTELSHVIKKHPMMNHLVVKGEMK